MYKKLPSRMNGSTSARFALLCGLTLMGVACSEAEPPRRIDDAQDDDDQDDGEPIEREPDAARPRVDASKGKDASPVDKDAQNGGFTDAESPPEGELRGPCCAIDGGAPPPTKELQGCTSGLIGEPAPPPPDICAVNGLGDPSSTSSAMQRKLLAGHSYRYSFTQLQAISGDPIVVDIFGSDEPCVRKELLFTLTLDGRLSQEVCFTPQHDTLYSVTRIQVGTVAFNFQFGDALIDLCEQASCPAP